MNSVRFVSHILFITLLLASCDYRPDAPIKAENARVKIVTTDNGYQLLRDGKPYFIKGGSGNGSLQRLKEVGGNSIRTYTTENAQAVLDEAQRLGMTVMLGIWIEPYSGENTFTDSLSNARILRFIEREVNRYKDHPALLMWGIGNEVHPIDPNVNSWKFLSSACKLVQELDPHHPVTTSIAGYPRRNIPFMNHFLSDVDLVAFNTFGGINAFEEKMESPFWGYEGPYMLSEWGYYGYWSVAYTEWHSPMEPYTNSKATRLSDVWQNYITKDPRCIGGYVFYWGQKQEYTHSWYSLFSPEGEETLLLDTLSSVWGGVRAENMPPHLLSMKIENADNLRNLRFTLGSPQVLTLDYNEPDEDSVTVQASIRHETSMRKNVEGIEQEPLEVSGLITRITSRSVAFQAPVQPGIYRIYVKLTDGHNNCDMANLVFMVSDQGLD